MVEIKIAIVGGGISGLTTAYLLKKLSLPEDTTLNIHLIEATDRVGGRVFTLRGFEDGLFAELGAISIADNEHEIRSLAQELGIPLEKRVDRKKRRYFENGQWQLDSDIAVIMTFLIQEISILKAKGIIIAEQDWVSTDAERCAVLDALDNLTIAEYLTKALEDGRLTIKHPDRLTTYLGASLLGHYCSDISKLSAFDGLRYLSQYGETNSVYSIVDGNDKLTKALYSAIVTDTTVVLNSPVSQIERNTQGKYCVTINSAQVDFDYVVMAVPLSSLQVTNDKRIKFIPPLPQHKSEAINSISYNRNVARLYYEVQSRFWLQDNPETGMVIVDRETCWIEDHTAHLASKQHAVLEAHTGGAIGRTIVDSDNPVGTGEDQIADVYGDRFKQARTSKTPFSFFWSKQPYQQGAYPNLLMGQRTLLQVLGNRVGNLFFIGEYTSIGHPASMNGAVRSAHKVLGELNEEIWTQHRLREVNSAVQALPLSYCGLI